MFDCLEDLEDAVDKLVASETSLDVERLRRSIERLEYAWLQAARAAERSGDWQAEGFVSAASWLRERCHLTHGSAAASLSLARSLERLPLVAEAFASGSISRIHAQVVASAATPERATSLADVEAQLVQVAETASPKQLRDVVQYITDAIDGDDGAATVNARHVRRYLHASPTLDGMVAIDGMLDAECGEIVISALDGAMESARAAGDPRSKPQQRADALTELCRVGVEHHAQGPGRRNRPHISAVIDVEVLEGRAGPDLVAQVRAEAEHTGRLSVATLERLCCDAGISRVITQGRSEPIDVGRTTRTIPPALWRALVVRDGGCVVPGCDRRSGWTEVHHRTPWSRGGETNLANCELRCWRHHRAVHEGGNEGGHDPP